MLKTKFSFIKLFFTLAIFLIPFSTKAATLIVNTNQDIVGQPQTLVNRCINLQLEFGPCSLRDASTLSNQLGGLDSIILPAQTYALSLGELKFNGDVTLSGSSPQNTIITNAVNKKNRILNFKDANEVSIIKLSVKGGYLESKSAGDKIKYQGGAGIYGENVNNLKLTEVDITQNKVKLLDWKAIKSGDSNESAASAIYLKGGLTLIKSKIIGNQIIQGDPEVTIKEASTIFAKGENNKQNVTIQNSFIEQNSYEGNLKKLSTNDLIQGSSISISRSFFRNNGNSFLISTLDDPESEGLISISESSFEKNKGISIFPLASALNLSQSTFNENELFVYLEALENGDKQRSNMIINNTFKSTNILADYNQNYHKILALNGFGSEDFKKFRSTLVVHNTFHYTAPKSSTQTGFAISVTVPTTIQNNIIYANAEAGFTHEIFPCLANPSQDNPNQLSLISLGGNLTFSPNLNDATPAKYNCNASNADLTPADPLLNDLKLNGGWTPTMEPQKNSPALSVAVPVLNTSVPFDQRGVKRPQGTGEDVGAFESKEGPIPQ